MKYPSDVGLHPVKYVAEQDCTGQAGLEIPRGRPHEIRLHGAGVRRAKTLSGVVSRESRTEKQ